MLDQEIMDPPSDHHMGLRESLTSREKKVFFFVESIKLCLSEEPHRKKKHVVSLEMSL
jgi:hypothetical protein